MVTLTIILAGVFFLYLLAFLYWRFILPKNSGAAVPVLLFHKIETKREWGVTGLQPEKFNSLLCGLKDLGYEGIGLDEALTLPPGQSEKRVLITFDDGYQGVYTKALPIMESLDFKAAVFVITGFVGRENSWDMNLGGRKFNHLNWEQIQELDKRGFSIGSHTVNHPDLTKITPRQLEFELKKSKLDLEEKLNREVAHLSYPFGRFNQAVQREAERAGYRAAFSIYPGRAESLSENLAIKRLGIYNLDSSLSLKVKLEGGLWFWLEDFKGYLINRLSLATTLIRPLPDYPSV